MVMHSLFDKYPEHNQECFCRLDSGLYRVYWYDNEMRCFYSNGAMVHNITHWYPVMDMVRLLEENGANFG